MNKGLFVTLSCFLFTAPACPPAQTAERLDKLLDSAGVRYAEAAMMVLPAAALAGEDVAPEAAFAEARSLLPRAAEPGGAARLGSPYTLTGAFATQTREAVFMSTVGANTLIVTLEMDASDDEITIVAIKY